MQIARTILIGAILLGAVAARGQTKVLTVRTSGAPVGSAIWSIENAAEPSAATQAYAAGISSGGDIAALEGAYIKRMVDFGVPEMALTQAQDLSQRDPTNGVARAVQADAKAKRQEMNEALADVVKAVDRSPDDAFVQRTAGQLAAWYDMRADRSKIPAELKQDVDSMRRRIGQAPTFVYAYERAREGEPQQQPALLSATQPLADQSAPEVYVAPAAIPAGSPVPGYSVYNYNSYAYPSDGYVSGAWGYWPGPVYYGPAVIVRGGGFRSHGFSERGFVRFTPNRGSTRAGFRGETGHAFVGSIRGGRTTFRR